ncbi:DUF6318 family protein [Brachybacterium muris]|uniref:DUF6318 family protein n=1 Tax=Brachybacterium muris TaxID=219301 RepID=UPI0021A521FA|nr:DUF6318 family protein [Brachybacterium muris]
MTTPPPSINIGGGSDNGGAGPSDGGSDASDGGGDSPVAAPDIPAPDPADYPGMDQNTPEGAEQAFKYYIAVSMWSHQVGDDSLLRTLEVEDCGSCDEFNGELPGLIEHGDTWSEFDITDVSSNAHPSESFDFEIGYMFSIGEHSRPNYDTGGREDTPVVEYVTIGAMNNVGGKWVVAGVTSEWGPNAHEG